MTGFRPSFLVEQVLLSKGNGMTTAQSKPDISERSEKPVADNKDADGTPDPIPRREPKWKAPLLGWSVIVFLLVAWQISAETGLVAEVFASKPTAVAQATWAYVVSEQFYSDLNYTGQTFVIGLSISVVAGTALGALMGWFTWLRYSLDYIISVAYAAPRIALIPLIILWFGIGMQAGIVIVILLTIWPPIMNTMTAIRTIDAGYLDLGRSLKMSRTQLFRYVLIPAAVPSILTAVRLSIGLALIGVVVAEFLAGTQGIGYRINEAASQYQADRVFGGLVLLSAAGVFLTELVKLLERHFDRWRTR
jgi:ABC-type nitrate/sulfonate/bicarbonate transport system permease component